MRRIVLAKKHKGKTAIVSGGASGIGKGIVSRLHEEGANVIIADNNVIEGQRLAEELGCAFSYLDVSNEEMVEEFIENVSREFNGLDIMVNNAGIIHIEPIIDMSFYDWKKIIDINLHGVFLGSQAAAKVMIEHGNGGSIINASSGAGRRGVANISAYCASKAAIISMSQTLALEVAKFKIRVNCYTPGHIETPLWRDISKGFSKMLDKQPEDVLEMFKNSIPMGRFGTPEDVAAAVSWLASEDASYVSGQCIGINGAEFPF